MPPDKFTPEILASFKDKDSKVERFRELYEKNDFIAAYSAHTDLRMQDDPKWAIGRGDEWESHGKLQLEFLIKQGMKPEHLLLDVGCGPGRAARRFVPYLSMGNYVGVDISRQCIEHAWVLSEQEGWADKKPLFILNGDLRFDALHGEFDFIWAHSVFTHLPSQQIETMIDNAVKLLSKSGKFLFTYKSGKKPERTGLKQFRYDFKFFEGTAKSYGLVASPLSMIWPATQHTGLITRAA